MTLVRVEIEHFRGIPGGLSLELPHDEGGAALIISGDNGTGKSSVVDALEVGLQARLHRRKQRLAQLAEAYASDSPPRIQLAFLNGDTVAREFERDEDGRVVLRDRAAVNGYG